MYIKGVYLLRHILLLAELAFHYTGTLFHDLKYSSAKQSSATCQNAEKKYLVSYQQP